MKFRNIFKSQPKVIEVEKIQPPMSTYKFVTTSTPSGKFKNVDINTWSSTNIAKYRIFDKLREGIPVLNRAINLYTKLIGNIHVEATDKNTQTIIDAFLKDIKVNDFGIGISEYISQIIDPCLHYGSGWSETLIAPKNAGIERLRIQDTKQLRFAKSKTDGLRYFALLDGDSFQPRIIKNQEAVQYIANDPRNGEPYGRSLWDSAAFVSQIYIRVLESFQNAVVRYGDPVLFVKVETTNDFHGSESDLNRIMDGIENAMKKTWQTRFQGKTGDVYVPTVPGVVVTVESIGSDMNIMDITIPMKVVESNIESATGFPGFMLGIYAVGNTGFKISTHQNDIIVQNIQSLRRLIKRVVGSLLIQHLALQRATIRPLDIYWDAVNLMDEVELARANFLNSQAAEKMIGYLVILRDNGIITDQELMDQIIENGIILQSKVKEIGAQEFLKSLRSKDIVAKLAQMSREIHSLKE